LTLAGEDSEIKERYLSAKITGPAEPDTAAHPDGMTLQEVTERMERQMVARALRETGGNRSQAARNLGLTRQGLLNKIARYKIEI
ncbi:MAG: helix-turn-helix domain-containing protein, partial [Desulfobacterales bacterium]